jgi:hypothetical protein
VRSLTRTAYSIREFYRKNGRYPDYREDDKYPVLTCDGLEAQILDVRIREVLWMAGGSPEKLDPEGAKPVLEELMERFRGTAFGEEVKLWYVKLDQWKHLPKDKFIPSDEEMKAKIRELATTRIGDLKIDQPKVRERIIDEVVERFVSRNR